jgi:hypothetical protein
MKAVRANVIIDSGELIDQLGSKTIVTPDRYKRLSNQGIIVSVGPQCVLFTKEDIGKTCFVRVDRNMENRINPFTAQALGLSPHWHYNVHEDKIDCFLE